MSLPGHMQACKYLHRGSLSTDKSSPQHLGLLDAQWQEAAPTLGHQHQ